MWLKIVCAILLASGALGKSDELLDTLYGLQGRNKMSVCVTSPSGRWRRCDGALVNREWVVARAACIATAPTHRLTTERLSAGGDCRDAAAGYSGAYSSRHVRAHVMHPWFDLALVIVHMPYNQLDKVANVTKIRLNLKRHGIYRWMKNYFDIYALDRNQKYQLSRIARDMKAAHHPIWLFFMTMVAPTTLFMLLFIYVTFYTGTPQEIPYKKLSYSKKVTQV